MNSKKNIIFIILAGALVYTNSLKNSFVWDDISIIINNDFIKGYRLVKEIFLNSLYYFSEINYPYYRPIQTLSYVFDYSLWGLNPFGFHLTNVLLHICVAILIYFLINILFNNPKLSLVTSLLFVVHPINTSVVGYISSRADMLFTVFIILSLILFLKANNYKYYFLSFSSFILALLSKEAALIFPLCLIFIYEMYLRINNRRTDYNIKIARFWYIAFTVVTIVYILLRIKILGIKTNFPLVSYRVDFWVRLLALSKIIFNYLKLIYLPFGLHMYHNIAIPSATNSIIVLYIISVILVVIALFSIYKLNKTIFLSLGLFLLWIMPISVFLSLSNQEFYSQQKAVMAESWLYIPSIGIFILISYLTSKYLRNKLCMTIPLLIIIYFSAITIKENIYWRNNYILYSHTLRYVKNSSVLYRNLGGVYLNKQEVNKAIDMFNKALNIELQDKYKSILYKDIAYSYFLSNTRDKAIDACRKAIAINYNYADAHGYLGLIYSKDDLETNNSQKECKIALQIDPFNAISFNVLLELSRFDNQIKDYLIEKYNGLPNSYKNFSKYKIYRALGIIYLYNGMHSEAISNLKKAKEINPYDVNINNALAVYYSELEEYDKAIEFFKIALALNPFDKSVYKNFAILYNRLNRVKEAEKLIKKSESIDIF